MRKDIEQGSEDDEAGEKDNVENEYDEDDDDGGEIEEEEDDRKQSVFKNNKWSSHS